MKNKITINMMPIWLQAVTAAMIIGKIFEIPPVADWSWWLVTIPLWGPLALVLMAAGAIFSLAALNLYLKDRSTK